MVWNTESMILDFILVARTIKDEMQNALGLHGVGFLCVCSLWICFPVFMGIGAHWEPWMWIMVHFMTMSVIFYFRVWGKVSPYLRYSSLHPKFPAGLHWLARTPPPIQIRPFLSLLLQYWDNRCLLTAMPGFSYVGAGDLNLSLHDYVVNPWLTVVSNPDFAVFDHLLWSVTAWTLDGSDYLYLSI